MAKVLAKFPAKRRPNPMRRTSLSAVHVHVPPRLHTQAWLVAGQRAIRAALGRASIKAAKREGDGATPAGRFHPVRLWWRADPLPRARYPFSVPRLGAGADWRA